MTKQSNMQKTTRGFTLIELMIVLVIVGVLTAIALPSYNAYVLRTNRGHAKAALLKAAQWMERVNTAQGQYPSTLASGLNQVEGNRYILGFYPGAVSTNLDTTGQTFKLVAIPTGASANDPCGSLTVDNTNTRDYSPSLGSTMSLSDCWSK